MFEVARTPAALFRQMRAQGRELGQLELVRRAIDLHVEVYTARFEPDGTPFQVHGIGTASVVAQLGCPAHVVAASLVHGAFRTGDWGDGRPDGASLGRRARVRELLGEEAERFLVDLYTKRRPGVSELLVGDVDPEERLRNLVRLADLLDKWDDGRVMYAAHGRSDRDAVGAHRSDLVGLARKLGGSEFAESLETSFDRVDAETIPDSLKQVDIYSKVIPPASYRRRWALASKAVIWRRLRRARRAVGRRVSR